MIQKSKIKKTKEKTNPSGSGTERSKLDKILGLLADSKDASMAWKSRIRLIGCVFPLLAYHMKANPEFFFIVVTGSAFWNLSIFTLFDIIYVCTLVQDDDESATLADKINHKTPILRIRGKLSLLTINKYLHNYNCALQILADFQQRHIIVSLI